MIKKLVLATHNEGKLKEFDALLKPRGIEVVSAGSLGIAEPEETGLTFVENAQLKSRNSALASGEYALSDDSGLVVPRIGGQPGIYSARWAGKTKDFNIAFKRIEHELNEVKAPLNVPAYFISVLSLCAPNGSCTDFVGECHGHLSFPPRGEHGFGYDPIFIPEGFTETFAEISPEIKNKMSHRARAFEKFVEYIAAYKF